MFNRLTVNVVRVQDGSQLAHIKSRCTTVIDACEIYVIFDSILIVCLKRSTASNQCGAVIKHIIMGIN